MQVFECKGIEADFIDILNQHLYGRFVVKNHLCFNGVLALGDLAKINQVLGVKLAVGVALQFR